MPGYENPTDGAVVLGAVRVRESLRVVVGEMVGGGRGEGGGGLLWLRRDLLILACIVVACHYLHTYTHNNHLFLSNTRLSHVAWNEQRF